MLIRSSFDWTCTITGKKIGKVLKTSITNKNKIMYRNSGSGFSN